VRGSPRGRRWRILAESKALKARVYCCGSPGSPGGPRGRTQRHEGDHSREAAKALQGGEALEGEPQERYRHETRPEGRGRSKPSRARETPETEGVGRGKPERTGLPGPKALKGSRPVESRAVGLSGGDPVRSDSGEESKRRDGWAAGDERAARVRGWESLKAVERRRGAAEPIGRYRFGQ
jgi:hypothetical protein